MTIAGTIALTIAGVIAGGVAAGILIAYAVIITIRWLKNKIREKFANRNIKKVAFLGMEKLVRECPNEVSLDDLMYDGYSNVMASVDRYGHINDVDIIKDEGTGDPEVDRLLGRERMIVINK